ncbi:proteasome-activating nucleotidase [Lojkania enalia]|uniref:Proteasome-activating nucleotidase n=1 Tax=Lojkania enalia TaxID=147567 RepID=A0A9P4KJH5_9PLEO|nr:proteasome-activating nucleotidase [Didymosphaeria enalia]
MPATSDHSARTAGYDNALFKSFKEHCHGTRVDTKTTVLYMLREEYPEYHVTETTKGLVSLLEFAEAGKAVAIHDSNRESFNATRVWRSVGERVEKKLHPGVLRDEFRFSRFQYIWEGKEFVVYYVEWKDMLDNPQRMFYVLHPRNDANIVDGHCTDTDELLLAVGKWTSLLHEEIWVFDNTHWEKSKELYKSIKGSSWDDVILDPEMKKNIIEDVQRFFDNQGLYSQFAVPWKRGIIFHGVPGNGKTVSIKALMSSLYDRVDHIPSLYVKTFRDRCNGEEYSIRQIFERARLSAPCLLIFEDLDSLVGDDVRSYFLNEVDGLESNEGILMIGSTNHLDRLDPAISKRPSRFDRKYHFKLPGEEQRGDYAEYWRKKLLKNDTIDFPEELCPIIAKLTDGFSFAYLKELFVMALLSLVRGHKGDDYEMIEAENEPETANEEKAACEANPSCKEEEEQTDTCQCAKTCNTCKKPLPQETAPEKLTMPTVDIPEHLVDNTLLKVIRQQIRILHAEMDNTKEEQLPGGNIMASGKGNLFAAQMQVLRMRRVQCC